MAKAHERYSKEQFELAVQQSTSIAGVCRLLGIAPKGGNYGTIKRYIVKYDLDHSHFKGQGWNKGNVSDLAKSNDSVKRKLIKQRGHQCEVCLNTRWLSEAITLELEHVDADRSNNDPENLKLLCPNCHSQTPTWRRGASGPSKARVCPDCSGHKAPSSKRCQPCAILARNKSEW